jgi:flagellar biosynthesis protein FlhF
MKIKRYTAPSMRAALAQVRAEQGADAVILSSRRGDEGVEVIAAVDYDEALFADANRQRATAATPKAATQQPATAAPSPEPIEALRRAQRPVSIVSPPLIPASFRRLTISSETMIGTAPNPKPATRANGGYNEMQRELQNLRQMVETGFAGITWNDKRIREPLKARVLEELSAMDITPDVAKALAERVPQRTSLANPAHIPLALLVKHLPVVTNLADVSGGIMAVVGPAGAGKTTTIAKLAARWCMRHGVADLALVSIDNYRLGASDELTTHARALGAPLHVANGGKDLARTLERLKSKKLILIDTAGMGPGDPRLAEQLAALKLGAPRAHVLLALPAHGESRPLEEIVRAFAPSNPAACVLTKVDEAASLGAVMSATLRHQLKIAYVCNGQKVPEDMHAAHQRRVWLVQAALKLKEGKPPVRDEAYFVRNFGGARPHA